MTLQKFSGKTDSTNIAVIALVFSAIILFSRFYVSHPVDDDWSYIRAAETFYKTGEIKFTPWTSPSLVFQVVWGGLFAWIFGFSVNTLILSTQVISFTGMVFFYLLLREIQCTPRKAIFFTLLLIFNPFSFPLLYTFFTDQHFVALMLISVFFYYRGAARKKNLSLLLGAVFASCAVLIRQPGLLISVAAALYLMLRKDGWKKITLSLFLPAITFAIYTYWLQDVHGQTFSARQQMKWIIECLGNPVYIISKFFNRPAIILDFFGFCLIPFSLAILPRSRQYFSRQHSSVLIMFCLSGILFYIIQDHIGITSSIYNWENGFHFAFVSEYGYRGTENILLFFYKILAFFSFFSITFLSWLLIKKRMEIKQSLSSPFLLLILIPVLQFMFLMIVRYKFTRYYLVLLPFFILLISRALKHIKIQKKYCFPLLAGFVLFSFAGTQDFLSWNEAHWKLGERALRQGISARRLSGGFPWDCWHNMDYCRANPYDMVPYSYDIPWWLEIMTPAIDPEYLISNSAVPTGFYLFRYFYLDSYAAVDAEDYYSLLYRKKMKILLLKRQPRSYKNHEGEIRNRLLDNFIGAEISSEKNYQERKKAVRTGHITLNSISCNALVHLSRTGIAFRVSVPPQNCRLRVSLATDPGTWNSDGDGITFKIMMNDNLFENFFDEIGMVGEDQKTTFLKPRGYFFRSQPIYMHYLDPKHNQDQRKWHNISLDLSRFSGKVVDFEFVADPGPRNNDRNDIALWGEPVIEVY